MTDRPEKRGKTITVIEEEKKIISWKKSLKR